jgi:hypothetical protein
LLTAPLSAGLKNEGSSKGSPVTSAASPTSLTWPRIAGPLPYIQGVGNQSTQKRQPMY